MSNQALLPKQSGFEPNRAVSAFYLRYRLLRGTADLHPKFRAIRLPNRRVARRPTAPQRANPRRGVTGKENGHVCIISPKNSFVKGYFEFADFFIKTPLTFNRYCAIIYLVIEAWLSLVERCVRDAEVVGSNPVASTIFTAHKWRCKAICELLFCPKIRNVHCLFIK